MVWCFARCLDGWWWVDLDGLRSCSCGFCGVAFMCGLDLGIELWFWVGWQFGLEFGLVCLVVDSWWLWFSDIVLWVCRFSSVLQVWWRLLRSRVVCEYC